MRDFLTFGFLLLFFQIHEASGQASSDGPQYIIHPRVPMVNSPGGNKSGEIYLGTPVTPTEQRGSWVKITVETWVRADAVANRRPGTAASGPAATSPLTIQSYSTREVQEGLPAPRIYLSLKLKNISENSISSWEGILVAQRKSDESVLFRERVSDSGKIIPASGEQEVSFYWEQHETPFSSLKLATPETVQFEIFQVKAQ